MNAWPLLEDPLTPPVVAPPASKAETGRDLRTGAVSRGLVTPFVRGPSDFTSGTGAEVVRSNVRQILGTLAGSDDTDGELPWRWEFGSLLRVLRARLNSAVLEEQSRYFVGQAISRWEPRARVRSVTVDRDGEKHFIRLRWDLVASNDPSRVLVPGLETSVSLG
ncbi:MAG: GPW/gp25 family protein [Thermoplasmata archaeon]|nr:GPW/gp25 family protein [Thermoplasmata archaeon]MCI4354836.1 GPW/gp25 family protein [Thermoplasmata archaeon]